jgi:hypothetical protein
MLYTAILLSFCYNKYMGYNEKMLTTAGGKISCHRCQALSKRTQNQCCRPAIRGKSVCQFHGGKSTGAITPEGKERSRQAHIKTGEYTQESRLQHHRALLNLAYLEAMMFKLNMTTANQTRGAKPKGYVKYNSLDEIVQAIEFNKNQ